MSSVLSIRNSFAATPGPRLEEEGDFSGQSFREGLLRPAYLAALQNGENLLVDLDGTEGYATSFLEEAFGGLARQYSSADVARVLRFKSLDEPYLIPEIEDYIKKAND